MATGVIEEISNTMMMIKLMKDEMSAYSKIKKIPVKITGIKS